MIKNPDVKKKINKSHGKNPEKRIGVFEQVFIAQLIIKHKICLKNLWQRSSFWGIILPLDKFLSTFQTF